MKCRICWVATKPAWHSAQLNDVGVDYTAAFHLSRESCVLCSVRLVGLAAFFVVSWIKTGRLRGLLWHRPATLLSYTLVVHLGGVRNRGRSTAYPTGSLSLCLLERVPFLPSSPSFLKYKVTAATEAWHAVHCNAVWAMPALCKVLARLLLYLDHENDGLHVPFDAGNLEQLQRNHTPRCL